MNALKERYGNIAVNAGPAANVALTVAAATTLWGAAAAGRIMIPGTPVPITLQTFALMLIALMLPWRQAAAAVLLYLAAGAAGLPVFSGGGSTATLFGPSAGFLFGFFPAVIVTGLLKSAIDRFFATAHPASPASSLASRYSSASCDDTVQVSAAGPFLSRAAGSRWTAIVRWTAYVAAAAIGCIVIDYGFGIGWQSAITGASLRTVAIASCGFLVGDVIKAALAAAIATAIATAGTASRNSRNL